MIVIHFYFLSMTSSCPLLYLPPVRVPPCLNVVAPIGCAIKGFDHHNLGHVPIFNPINAGQENLRHEIVRAMDFYGIREARCASASAEMFTHTRANITRLSDIYLPIDQARN